MGRNAFLVAVLALLLAGCATPPRKAPVSKTNKQQKENKVMVLMKTSMGDIKLELDRDKAPKTVENFLAYAKSGYYDGTIFHRVIGTFMIQGGGFDANMRQKPAPKTVENEADNGLSNKRGTISMARTPDPQSASSQFFINVADNNFLDFKDRTPQGWGYCVFGKVVEGMDVVDAIKDVPTGRRGTYQDVPIKPVVIEKVVVLDD